MRKFCEVFLPTRPCGGAFHCNEGEVCREYWEVTINQPLKNSKHALFKIKTSFVRVQILGSPTLTTLCWRCWQLSNVSPSKAGSTSSTGWAITLFRYSANFSSSKSWSRWQVSSCETEMFGFRCKMHKDRVSSGHSSLLWHVESFFSKNQIFCFNFHFLSTLSHSSQKNLIFVSIFTSYLFPCWQHAPIPVEWCFSKISIHLHQPSSPRQYCQDPAITISPLMQ